MDPKASAKLKRAHTQHGRSNHPSPSAIAQRKKHSTAKDKKPASGGGGGDEEQKRSRAPALPSNWDCYDDEGEEFADAGNPASAGRPPAVTEVKPKSKGADFGYLLEQARSQQQERDKLAARGLSSEPSSQELPFGLMQGLSSMLSVRGKGILSSCADDNFIIDDDDDAPLNYEVPFLSIDLHAIDAQLSKLKLSERLFIEAELLAEEQYADELKENQISEQSEVSVASEFKHNIAPLASTSVDSQDCTNNCYIDSRIDEGALSEKYDSRILAGHATELDPTKGLTLQELSPSRVTQVSNSELLTYTVPAPTENTNSKFEVAAAEAELDMLLNSLSETSLSRTVADNLINNVSTPQNAIFYASANAVSLSSSKHPISSRDVTSSIDDDIDDLLAETSFCLKDEKNKASTIRVGASMNHSSYLVLGANSVDDSNSSRTETRGALDDAIDDLLDETSVFLENQKQESSATSLPLRPHLDSKPKPMDNFDSWFDSL